MGQHHGYRRTARCRVRHVDPVLVEIVEGYLACVEKEVETAIGRTSRSPMIRDAHDFRAGIHDRQLRKLTGRSYSALVHPVARDFPLETMRPGDVFFHNDVYLSEGGIGHLPDLCVTVPVFPTRGGGRRGVRAGLRAPRRHRGAVPGSMPSYATSVFEEGLMVPPIRRLERAAQRAVGGDRQRHLDVVVQQDLPARAAIVGVTLTRPRCRGARPGRRRLRSCAAARPV